MTEKRATKANEGGQKEIKENGDCKDYKEKKETRGFRESLG